MRLQRSLHRGAPRLASGDCFYKSVFCFVFRVTFLLSSANRFHLQSSFSKQAPPHSMYLVDAWKQIGAEVRLDSIITPYYSMLPLSQVHGLLF